MDKKVEGNAADTVARRLESLVGLVNEWTARGVIDIGPRPSTMIRQAQEALQDYWNLPEADEDTKEAKEEEEYIGDSITVRSRLGYVILTQEHSDGSGDTIRMDPLALAHFLGWLEDTELFKSIPRGWSLLLDENDPNQWEVETGILRDVVDAWSRGFNPQPALLGAIARDLLRTRGISSMKCSLCGEETLVPNHKCNQNWRTRK